MFDEYRISEVLRRAPGYAIKTARRLVIRQYMRRYFSSHPAHLAQSRDAAIAMVRAADSVLVLCWGNVCRSPLAEQYLETQCENRKLELAVDSAGLGESDGRASPPNAVDSASAYGVDLSTHRSKRVEPDAVDAADVVFVMDFNNYYSLTTQYEGVHHKTFFLGTLDEDESDSVQIGDPYGHDRTQFAGTYDRITTALDRLVDELIENER